MRCPKSYSFFCPVAVSIGLSYQENNKKARKNHAAEAIGVLLGECEDICTHLYSWDKRWTSSKHSATSATQNAVLTCNFDAELFTTLKPFLAHLPASLPHLFHKFLKIVHLFPQIHVLLGQFPDLALEVLTFLLLAKAGTTGRFTV